MHECHPAEGRKRRDDLINESPEGAVLCISIAGVEDVAVWGGLMTAGAVANKLAGAILDGGVRDLTELRRDYDFPVYARAEKSLRKGLAKYGRI